MLEYSISPRRLVGNRTRCECLRQRSRHTRDDARTDLHLHRLPPAKEIVLLFHRCFLGFRGRSNPPLNRTISEAGGKHPCAGRRGVHNHKQKTASRRPLSGHRSLTTATTGHVRRRRKRNRQRYSASRYRRRTGLNRSPGKRSEVTRMPNLSPTLTASPSATGWSPTCSESISSHDLSN